MSLSAKAASVAVKGFGVALNVVAGVGMGLLISGLTTLIMKFATASETLRENTLDASVEYTDATKSISEYKKEVESLSTSLSSGSLSIEEQIQARNRLIKIQDELRAKYGSEASSLNLVAMSADEAASAFDRLAASEAAAYLQENEAGIHNATRKMNTFGTQKVSFDIDDISDYDYRKMREVASEIEGLSMGPNGNGEYVLTISADPKTAYESIQEFKNSVEDKGVDLGAIHISGDENTSALDWLNSSADKRMDVINENGQIFEAGIDAKIASVEKYANLN